MIPSNDLNLRHPYAEVQLRVVMSGLIVPTVTIREGATEEMARELGKIALRTLKAIEFDIPNFRRAGGIGGSSNIDDNFP